MRKKIEETVFEAGVPQEWVIAAFLSKITAAIDSIPREHCFESGRVILDGAGLRIVYDRPDEEAMNGPKIGVGRHRGFRTREEAERFARSLVPPAGKSGFVIYELSEGANLAHSAPLGYFVQAAD